jgi:hypothetical protein
LEWKIFKLIFDGREKNYIYIYIYIYVCVCVCVCVCVFVCVCVYIYIYRASEEERTIFWEVIVSVILSKKIINMFYLNDSTNA